MKDVFYVTQREVDTLPYKYYIAAQSLLKKGKIIIAEQNDIYTVQTKRPRKIIEKYPPIKVSE